MVDRRSKILVVDDNQQNRLTISETLEAEGFEIVEARDGIEAVTAFQEHAPDCILMDVRMPGLDGFGASARIRALPGGPETPILFVTALRDVETFDAAQRAGSHDFLTKPLNLSELVVRVRLALRMHQVHLELRGAYDMIKKQRDEALRLQLQKERLTAFIVHDLKGPVAAIDLNAQLLLRDESMSAKSRQVAQQIRSDERAMSRLILNLLDISRGEEGRLQPRKADVSSAEIVHEVTEMFGGRAADRGVTIESAVEAPRVRAERDLLRRIVENLVDNAIRHAPRGTAIRIVVTRSDGAVEVRVADQGSGVPQALRDKIFDKYVQLEDGGSPAKDSNRGLGLTFCKLAVEAHGGTMVLEDTAQGASFCASFPD